MMKTASRYNELTIHIDGACSGNPGDAGIGVAVYDRSGELIDEVSRYIGRATNNIAEYSALVIGLQRAQQLGASAVTVKSDSELLVRQITGMYKIKNEGLKPLFKQATALMRQFNPVRIEHVRRELNKAADRLARQSITDYRRANRTVAAADSAGEESPSSTGQRSG